MKKLFGKNCALRRMTVPVLILVLTAVWLASPRPVKAAFDGSHMTSDAFDALTVGQTVNLTRITGTSGYDSGRKSMWALGADGSIMEQWEENVLGSGDGVPFFCIEQDVQFVPDQTATVYDGLSFLSQDVITRAALACRYLEDHIDEMNGNKTDLYFLQQAAVWEVVEEAGTDTSGGPVRFVVLQLESRPDSGDALAFSIDILDRAKAWADAERGRYTGQCKVLVAGSNQKCAVFKAVRTPVSITVFKYGGGTLGDAGQTVPAAGVLFRHLCPDGSTEEKITDETGRAVFENLDPGDHEILEAGGEGTDGYSVNRNRITFRVDENGEITFTSGAEETEISGIILTSVGEDGNGQAVVYNQPLPFRIRVKKENENGQPLAGAVFHVYSSGECSEETLAGTGVSGEDGVAFVAPEEGTEGFFPGQTLYLKEVSPPEGYELTGEENVYQIRVESEPAADLLEVYVDGSRYTEEQPGEDVEICRSADGPEVWLTVRNRTGRELPETGSAGTLAASAAGTVLMGAALRMYRTRKRRTR